MILVIDNYDSFTCNLVHYLMELGAEVEVVRNDAHLGRRRHGQRRGGLPDLARPLHAQRGGHQPRSRRRLRRCEEPLLGVCLGHQAIGQHFGGNVVRGGLMHGKTSPVDHDGSGVFAGLPCPFIATRYHSLIVEDIPDVPGGQRHQRDAGARRHQRHGLPPRELPIHGVQFHPESIATEHGHALLANFLQICGLPSRSSRHERRCPPVEPHLTEDEAEAAFAAMLDGETVGRGDRPLPRRAGRSRRDRERDRRRGARAARPADPDRGARQRHRRLRHRRRRAPHAQRLDRRRLVVAACGVPVAKHGNRAASSKAGAADTLEALGLDMEAAGRTAEMTLRDIGICFLFAANHHPAMRRIQPIRQKLGRRTIFNLMGPLANPAQVSGQLIGIARPAYVPIYAEAMARLGTDAR